MLVLGIAHRAGRVRLRDTALNSCDRGARALDDLPVTAPSYSTKELRSRLSIPFDYRGVVGCLVEQLISGVGAICSLQDSMPARV